LRSNQVIEVASTGGQDVIERISSRHETDDGRKEEKTVSAPGVLI
jgi:hypothetical protein